MPLSLTIIMCRNKLTSSKQHGHRLSSPRAKSQSVSHAGSLSTIQITCSHTLDDSESNKLYRVVLFVILFVELCYTPVNDIHVLAVRWSCLHPSYRLAKQNPRHPYPHSLVNIYNNICRTPKAPELARIFLNLRDDRACRISSHGRGVSVLPAGPPDGQGSHSFTC